MIKQSYSHRYVKSYIEMPFNETGAMIETIQNTTLKRIMQLWPVKVNRKSENRAQLEQNNYVLVPV